MNNIIASIRPEFIMEQQHIDFLNQLPDNLPETKLTKKQIETVGEIYYKYISNKVYRGWGQDLAEFEQKVEKWPSGPRVKRHEAQRMILGHLVFMNEHKRELNGEQAAKFFFSVIGCRESYQVLVSKIYEVK